MIVRLVSVTITNGKEWPVEKTVRIWPVAEAKAKLSEVIDHALTNGPQTITRKGRIVVVVVAAEEWERKSKREGTLADFFAASPLRDSGLQIERLKDGAREIDL